MWRRESVLDTRPATASEAAPPTTSKVSVVDDALRVASGRELFTRVEAMRLLHEVEVSTHDLPTGARILEIVNEVDADSRDQFLMSRADVVDPLLDIRLLVVN